DRARDRRRARARLGAPAVVRRAAPAPLRGEQLRVEALAELAQLAALGLDEVLLAEQLSQLRGRPLEQALRELGPRLDLEAKLRRAGRELERVPGQIEAVQAVLVAVARAPVAQLADRMRDELPVEVAAAANRAFEAEVAQGRAQLGGVRREGVDL